jgi:hypothetical protein|tara:strand:- start:75 stop:293 length:219 start_codon:yes stop_codon:yes gene_type:complete
MESEYVCVFKENRIIVGRLKMLLEEEEVYVRLRSDTIPGYELTYHVDELFILKKDMDRAVPIIKNYKLLIGR